MNKKKLSLKSLNLILAHHILNIEVSSQLQDVSEFWILFLNAADNLCDSTIISVHSTKPDNTGISILLFFIFALSKNRVSLWPKNYITGIFHCNLQLANFSRSLDYEKRILFSVRAYSFYRLFFKKYENYFVKYL